MSVWYHAIAEAKHELQNPTSREKILAAARAAGLGPGSEVLDLAGGKGGPAALLAEEIGCRVTLVEQAPEFAAAARARGDRRIEVVEGDATAYEANAGAFDAALCLGATFVWSGLEGTIAALLPAVRPGGYVVVGEPYWRRLPLPDDYPDDEGEFTTLVGTVAKIEQAGLALVALLASSDDDWDRYESLHWQAVEEWASENLHHPAREEILGRHRDWRERYVRWDREVFGWAIFVAHKP
jgi:SAM-dependent methyltransferase